MMEQDKKSWGRRRFQMEETRQYGGLLSEYGHWDVKW